MLQYNVNNWRYRNRSTPVDLIRLPATDVRRLWPRSLGEINAHTGRWWPVLIVSHILISHKTGKRLMVSHKINVTRLMYKTKCAYICKYMASTCLSKKLLHILLSIAEFFIILLFWIFNRNVLEVKDCNQWWTISQFPLNEKLTATGHVQGSTRNPWYVLYSG